MRRKSKALSTKNGNVVENYPAMIFPEDLNPQDMMFGGMLVGTMDKLAASIFFRHAEGQSCGTNLIDRIPVPLPVYKGDVLLLCGAINRVWNTSCEIGIRARIQRKRTGVIQYLSSTYFTYVATEELDEKDLKTGHPKLKAVPIKFTVSPRTSEEKRRFKEAEERRKERLEKENRKTRD